MITEDQIMKMLVFGIYNLYMVDARKPIICTGVVGNDKYRSEWNRFFKDAPVMKQDPRIK